MEDSEIIRLYWQREPRAIDETSGKYGSYCMTVARNILGSPEDSEECVNDTWLGAWNSMPPHKPDVLRLFLAKITRRLSLDRVRSGKTRKRGGGELPAALDELSECIASETDVEGDAIAGELGEAVGRFVAALPDREAAVFLRRYFFTEPIAKIAESCGLKEGSITSMLCRTRKKLGDYLKKEGWFDES